MKLENFFLAIRVLKYVEENTNCTIPQMKDFYEIDSFNPPQREEKDLYKVIAFLDNYGFLTKIDNEFIIPGGARYFLKITPKGSQLLEDIRHDLTNEKYNLSKGIIMKKNDYSSVSTEFSKFSYEILISVLHGLLDELDYETRRILNSKKPRINVLIEKCHTQLQEKFSRIIDSLI